MLILTEPRTLLHFKIVRGVLCNESFVDSRVPSFEATFLRSAQLRSFS